MIPYYRAKSNERKNTYIEGLLIGVDEELNLCTIRTKDDYIGGEVCYLHTLSINFPDMIDSRGNKIFASLQKDGKGGDIINCYLGKNQIIPTREKQIVKYYKPYYMGLASYDIDAYSKLEAIGIQQ